MKKDKNALFRSLCPIATGLDVLGDKWSLLILRDMLFLHKSTFNEFKDAPELIPSKMLSNRLKKLESLGFLCRKKGEINRKNVQTFPIMVELSVFTTNFFYDHLGETYTEVVKTRMENDKEIYVNEMIESYKSFKEKLVI
jgi:DNA-binding HxlR family transcriptional regulator